MYGKFTNYKIREGGGGGGGSFTDMFSTSTAFIHLCLRCGMYYVIEGDNKF